MKPTLHPLCIEKGLKIFTNNNLLNPKTRQSIEMYVQQLLHQVSPAQFPSNAELVVDVYQDSVSHEERCGYYFAYNMSVCRSVFWDKDIPPSVVVTNPDRRVRSEGYFGRYCPVRCPLCE